MDYEKQEDTIAEKVEDYLIRKGWPEKLQKYPYHNWEHILEIKNLELELGRGANLPLKDMETLTLSALFHDLGYYEGAEDHEERSCQIAQEVLENFGVSQARIDQIKRIILATKAVVRGGQILYIEETTFLGELLRDADIGASLASKRYMELQERLRKELGAKDKEAWLDLQERLLSSYRFRTGIAEKLFRGRVKNNLKRLREWRKRTKKK